MTCVAAWVLLPLLWTDLVASGPALAVVAGLATLALGAGAMVRRRRTRHGDDVLDLEPVISPAEPEAELPIEEAPEELRRAGVTVPDRIPIPAPRLPTIDLVRDIPDLGAASPRLAGLLQRLVDQDEEEGSSPVGPMPVDMLLAAVLEELAPAVEERGLEVEVEDWIAPAEVLGQELPLLRGLYELLVNALDFAPEGTRVRVRVVDLGLRNAIVVEDEGGAIECAELGQVFPSVAETRPDSPWGIDLPGAGRLEFRPWSDRGSCLRLAIPVFAPHREPHMGWL